jgi:hypothetical protein
MDITTTVEQPLSTCGLGVSRQHLSSVLTSWKYFFDDEGRWFVQIKCSTTLPNRTLSHPKRQSFLHSKSGRHDKFLITNEPYLFHIPARNLYVGRYPFTTCSVTGPTHTLSPSSYWRRLFSSQTFSLLLPKLFSNLVIYNLPDYEDVTECSETSAYTIQTTGNYPKESMQHNNFPTVKNTKFSRRSIFI